jgi:hypothetical protein
MKALNLPSFVRSIRLNWTFLIGLAYAVFAFFNFKNALEANGNFVVATGYDSVYIVFAFLGIIAGIKPTMSKGERSTEIIGRIYFSTHLINSYFVLSLVSSNSTLRACPSATFIITLIISATGIIMLLSPKIWQSIKEFSLNYATRLSLKE